MKATHNYEQDLAEIRQMMERSSKFLSLSGWSGILAGVYAVIGAFAAHYALAYRPNNWATLLQDDTVNDSERIVFLALGILLVTLITVVYLSAGKAKKRNEKLWNPTSKRLLVHFGLPLVVGGLFLLILFSQGLISLLAPVSLLFYGLAIHGASQFTFPEMRFLGLIQLTLGLIGCAFPEYGLLLWAVGFGLVHIAYGLHLHFKYER